MIGRYCILYDILDSDLKNRKSNIHNIPKEWINEKNKCEIDEIMKEST